MKTQKLGRGLDALLGEMDEAYENEGSQKDSVLEISVKDIRPNPYQPRKSFNEEALLELSESIKCDGLLQPIVVSEDIDGYVLVAGERRLRATKLAKIKEIRAVVLNSDDQKMRQFALIENIQREQLNSVELADAYQELLKLHELTHEELSVKIHKSRTHITNTLRLLQLSAKTQKALVEKKITAGHAKVLNFTPVVSTRPAVESYDFDDIKDRCDMLGLNVKSSNNKITLEFQSQDEVNEFLNYLYICCISFAYSRS